MPKYRILLTRKAKDDIIDIGDYITYTLLEPDIAQDLVKGLRKIIDSLKDFPNSHVLVDDVVLSSQGIRCMPYKNYFVFYEVIDGMNTVIILRVGYNRRNWKELLTK